jgi:hypothetical protein
MFILNKSMFLSTTFSGIKDSKRSRRVNWYCFDSFVSFDYSNFSNYCDCFQVRRDLGIADHVWVDKRKTIAKKIDDMGDQFRHASGGMACIIMKTYQKLSVLVLRLDKMFWSCPMTMPDLDLLLVAAWFPQ